MKKLDVVIDNEIRDILKKIVEDCFWEKEIKIDWENPTPGERYKDVSWYHVYYADPSDLITLGTYIQIARDKIFRLKLQQQ